MENSSKSVKRLIEENNFTFKKMYGQNFIINHGIIQQIITKSKVDHNTLVIEIGPGAGALTIPLSEVCGQVLCYEIDNSLRPVLDQVLKDKDNVEVVYQDFLHSDLKNDLKRYHYSKIYVVANLPYYITTPIIMKLIEEEINVNKIVVMVQKEVGNRFKAEPGSKDYNSLSVFLNYYFDIKKIIDVSRNSFIPKPNVDSIVIELTKKVQQIPLKNKELFFKLIRDSFCQKRKTIKNNLKQYNLEIIQEILSKYSMDLTIRAEHIPIEVFIDIANSLDEY